MAAATTGKNTLSGVLSGIIDGYAHDENDTLNSALYSF